MIGKPFITLNYTDSTNNHAMRMIKEGNTSHGTVFFAHEQSAGKGQSGRSWVSAPRQNIMISIVLQQHLPTIDRIFGISIVAALACLELFTKRTAGDMFIKWPNDIFWRDRKAGGILIENVISGHSITYSIVGIGLNINQTTFPDLSRKIVSLKQITGMDHDPVELAQELCGRLDEKFRKLNIQFDELLANYNQHLFLKGETIKYDVAHQTATGRLIGVSADGRIGIQNNQLNHYKTGDITWNL